VNRDELLKFLAPLPDDAIHGLTLYGEARGESIESIIAVSCVIRNRAQDAKSRWGKTFREVCLQKWQFSCWTPKGGEANHQTVMDAAKALLTKTPVAPALEQCAWVALGVGRGAILDTVKGSNHYHHVAMAPRPAWAQAHVPTVQKGAHLFYRIG
jgi:spore germination cell wall hydrolase CwlJ-like protein